MLHNLRKSVAKIIAPQYITDLELAQKNFEHKVNLRVAEYINKMDPFEPIFKKFKGVFSEEFQHPETKFDEKGQLAMMFWGYQQQSDPVFRYIIDWIINTQANDTLKRAPVTEERIMYGRAQISGMILFRDEVKRLANAYADHMEKMRPEEPDEENTVDG